MNQTAKISLNRKSSHALAVRSAAQSAAHMLMGSAYVMAGKPFRLREHKGFQADILALDEDRVVVLADVQAAARRVHYKHLIPARR